MKLANVMHTKVARQTCYALVAVAAAVALGALDGSRLRAQSPPQPAAKPTFDVVSVKTNKSGEPFVRFGGGRGQFTATNVLLGMLIQNAYGLQPSQIVGAPKWTTEERFDILAKMPEESDLAQRPLMMQALLADRFKLVVHTETRESQIYALVPLKADGKLGPRMQPASAACAGTGRGRFGMPPLAPGAGSGVVTGTVGAPPPPTSGARGTQKPGADNPAPAGQGCSTFMGPGNITAASMSMAQLAQSLSQQVGRMVVDKTGLAGSYEFTLQYTPDQMPPGAGLGPLPPGAPPLPPIDPNGPSLFTALQEQLGLKLESQRGPMEVLVIDSVDRPTED